MKNILENTIEPSKALSIDDSILTALQEYLEENENTDVFSQVISIYIKEAQLRLNDLQEAIDTKDIPKMILTAHGLKGSSSTLGILKLSELCFDLEQLARKGLLDDAYHIISQLQEEFNHVHTLLLSKLPNPLTNK